MEEINAAHKWLSENTDKWENFATFEFLVPIDEVPPEVIKYCKFEEENSKLINEQNELLEKMGVI